MEETLVFSASASNNQSAVATKREGEGAGEAMAAPEQLHAGERSPEAALNLPYPVTLIRGEPGVEGEWLATVDTLAGCSATASTPEEALARVSQAVDEWLEAAERDGRDVPDPKSLQSHSGRLLLRMPQTLHAELSRVAERERVSLNQFITDVLSGTVGWRVPARGGRIATRAVDAAVPRPNGNGEIAEVDPPSPGHSPGEQNGMLTLALVANLVVVALAAIVAIVVFIAVWL
ncbi:MAG TPA: type II toxin-antitoxin system HicB family antitoxin [Gaiellaceae bacterium]